MHRIVAVVAFMTILASATAKAEAQFFKPGDVFWCREKLEQVNMHLNQGIGASNTIKLVSDSFGPFEELTTEAKKTAIKALLAAFQVAKSSIEGAVGEFEEGLRAGCGRSWSAADAQEIDDARATIKTIDTHTAQFEDMLKSLQ